MSLWSELFKPIVELELLITTIVRLKFEAPPYRFRSGLAYAVWHMLFQ